MNNLMSLLPLIAIAAFIWWIVRAATQRSRVWRNTPTLQEYVQTYPHCNTGNGIKCVRCGSKSIRNWGLENATSTKRVFICNHCNGRLYRNQG